MKHLYKSILLCMSLCAAATAPAQVFIGDSEYTTLADALGAAQSGAIIEIKSDIQLTKAIAPGIKDITIKGATDTPVTITQAPDLQLISLSAAKDPDPASRLTIENVIFKGSADSSDKLKSNIINCPKGSYLSMSDVTVTGFRVNATNGLMRALAETTVILNNVAFSDNVYSDAAARYDIYIPNESTAVTMSGTVKADIYFGKAFQAIDGHKLSDSSRLGIYILSGATLNSAVIDGVSDIQLATLLGDDTRIIAPKIDGESHSLVLIAKPAILNATTGDIYTDLKTANANAPTGSHIIVYKDLDISNPLGGNSKTLTFVAATPGIKLTRKAAKLIVSCAKGDTEDATNITLDGFVIDGSALTDPSSQASYLLEGRAGGMAILRNVTFTNVWNAVVETLEDKTVVFKDAYRSLMRVYPSSPGAYLLDNVKFENCIVPEGSYHALANIAGMCAVSGDCNFSVQVAKGVSLAAEGLTGVIELNAVSPVAGAQVVTGCDDPDRFHLTNDGWMLTASDGGLSLAEAPLTIADPTVTGDNGSKHYAGTDLIYIPAGVEATVTFDIPAGATLEYYFEPRNFNPGARRAAAAAPAWAPYPADGIKVSETGWLHLRMTRGSQSAERSMYVFDEAALTGIDGITADDAPARYYDMRGIEVSADALQPGIYIERRGAATRRIIVR
ncbi:MAG: hypothetical protein NC406_04745 [Bacteroides sp.]|nr:hypothetical protein [Bacteroides sp.]MCM1095517.1 hypothetical protein [Terasakiella sp.]